MHLEKIELHRFKQFRSGKVTLRPHLSLLVGGNNSGKSTILHALAVWEFCKTILEFSKGRRAWASAGASQGIGIGISEFSPISVPSLKHLWTNLKTQRTNEPDGYTLKIKAFWTTPDASPKYLEFGLSLANDRLFIKTTASNLSVEELQSSTGEPIQGIVPRVAYLPPFAGITDKESRSSIAVRNRLIGQGLSGGVIRNVLYDMWERNRSERSRLRGAKSKISNADLAMLRSSDPWELLSKTLGDLFQIGLIVNEFDDRYHTNLYVETFRGKMVGPTLKKSITDSSRDLMVEGSGFLQWLSVYALALSADIDVVLLDEPDAHLHCSLQVELVKQLSQLAKTREKQVLMATHSTELIKGFDYDSILEVKGGKTDYLAEEGRKVAVLAGIGTQFSPKLHALTQKKRMLIVESEFDETLLRIWAAQNATVWPENVVVWHWPGGHKQRRQLFLQLQREIPTLTALSLRDRDDETDASVNSDLSDKSQSVTNDGFQALKWRRRHIENYLLHPAPIARAAGITEQEVKEFLAGHHGLAMPSNVGASDVLLPVRDAHGKEITSQSPSSLESVWGISRIQIAKAMAGNEIAADVKKFLEILTTFAAA